MTRNDDLIGDRVRITKNLERYPLPNAELIGRTGRRVNWKSGPDGHTTHWLVEPDDSATSIERPVWIWVKCLAVIEGPERHAPSHAPQADDSAKNRTDSCSAPPPTADDGAFSAPEARAVSSGAERRTIPKALQFRVWSRDSWHCRYCLRPLFFAPTLRELERRAPAHGYYHRNGRDGAMLRLLQMGWASADHFVPVTDGGQNTEENLVAACMECNISRGDEPASSKARALKSIPPELRALHWDGFAAVYPALVAQPDEWCRLIAQSLRSEPDGLAPQV